jgi:flagellar protein FliO/FliZ
MKSLTRNRGAGVLTGALMLLRATAAHAAAAGEQTPLHLSGTTPGTHVSGGSGSSTIVRTVVGLFIVIVVIYGVAWILRQAKRGGSSRTRGKALSSVATLSLGSGRSVQLVRAGREFLLVGVGEHGVTPIRRYTEAEAIEAGLDVMLDDQFEPDLDSEERPVGRVVETLRRMTVRS